jgi:hypothetical protein
MGCVEVPPHQHEPEAYVPPEPDAGGEDDWPPASREEAIEYARQARLEEGGLPIDDATLERVADVIMDPEGDAGLFFTAEELDEEAEVDESDRRAVVKEYLRRHPEIDGGTRVGWIDGQRVLYVGLVGDADVHKAALSEIWPERVAFESVPRTVRALEAISDRVVADLTALRAAGFEVLRIHTDRQRGVVQMTLVGGRDAAAAEEYIDGRYGDAVAVHWRGPSPFREVPRSFGSWTSEGRLIRVFFELDRDGQRRAHARVAEETSERIVIGLTCLQFLGNTFKIMRPHHADLDLREPVGNRAVIDASAGVPRPSLAQLRSRRPPGPHRRT